ncbi:MAG: hypothetical protein LBT20_05570 [Clostridiales bacterium]|jgi:hypothetical protein|nr:hypothetical protein [Clostridiales bacterium]
MQEPKCKNCNFYCEYYTKGYDEFNRTRHGLCNKHHKDSDDKQICEFWKDNEKRKESRNRVILETMAKMEKYIREISQILKEDKGE